MLWVTISLCRGTGTVAIDGPRFEEFLRSRKAFAVELHSWVNFMFLFIFIFFFYVIKLYYIININMMKHESLD